MRDGDTTPPPEDSTPVRSYRLQRFRPESYVECTAPKWTAEWELEQATKAAEAERARSGSYRDELRRIRRNADRATENILHEGQARPCGWLGVDVTTGRMRRRYCRAKSCRFCGGTQRAKWMAEVVALADGRPLVCGVVSSQRWRSLRKHLGELGHIGKQASLGDGRTAYITTGVGIAEGDTDDPLAAFARYLLVNAKCKRARVQTFGVAKRPRRLDREQTDTEPDQPDDAVTPMATNSRKRVSEDAFQPTGVLPPNVTVADVARVFVPMGGAIRTERGGWQVVDVPNHLLMLGFRRLGYRTLAEAAEDRAAARGRQQAGVIGRRAHEGHYRTEAA